MRALLSLLLIIAVVVGALFWLAGRDTEVKTQQVEKAVKIENAA